MRSRQPVSPPLKTNRGATTQRAPPDANRCKKVLGLIVKRADRGDFTAEAAGANVPGDVGLSEGTLGKEWVNVAVLSGELMRAMTPFCSFYGKKCYPYFG